MFNGLMSFKGYKSTKKHRSDIKKLLVGKVSREEAVDIITYSYLSALESLERNLFKDKDIVLRAIQDHDESQANVDSCIADIQSGGSLKDIEKIGIKRLAEDYRDNIDFFLIAATSYTDRHNTYFVDHYMRSTFPFDKSSTNPMTVLPYDELWCDIENNPHYDKIWDELMKEEEEDSKYAKETLDPRIFKPEPSCIKHLYDFLSSLHRSYDNLFSTASPVYDKFGQPLGTFQIPVCVSRKIFGDDAPEKYGLPDEKYIAQAIPHLDFHGYIEEAPIHTMSFFALETDGSLVWDKSLLADCEIPLKNGDIWNKAFGSQPRKELLFDEDK